METKIKATGSVMLTDELQKYVDKKLQKIAKLIEREDSHTLVETELGTTSAGHRTGDVFRAEFNISIDGELIRGEATKDTLHSAIDAAIGSVRREVRKNKAKNRDLIRRGARNVKNFFNKWGK